MNLRILLLIAKLLTFFVNDEQDDLFFVFVLLFRFQLFSSWLLTKLPAIITDGYKNIYFDCCVKYLICHFDLLSNRGMDSKWNAIEQTESSSVGLPPKCEQPENHINESAPTTSIHFFKYIQFFYRFQSRFYNFFDRNEKKKSISWPKLINGLKFIWTTLFAG